ncbi:PilW family protein [Alkalimarinus alittae]|uniref:PilW family protein n=1 Tax=Alkalimarinus alittae TaxID=2961619 RepID=A0ABY6N0R6_9ALTE|nr:PilW family protein [Alkalimarinus alittae]UZE95602.1 PilW family protein [Alkalimarinus alittae]
MITHSHTRQTGFSLVELMIAMVLGLVLMAGVIQIFLGSKQTYSVVSAQSHTLENGRFGLFFISRSLRHAGYWGTIGVERKFPAVAEFTEGTSITFGRNNDATNADIEDGTDEIFIRMTGAPDGSIETCLGSSLLNNQLAVDHYYIRAVDPLSTENIPSLYCSSRVYGFTAETHTLGALVSSDDQPLVNGIENMQILYGIGSANEVTQYVNSTGVTNWEDVRAVKVALLSASNENTTGVTNTITYNLLDESVTAPGDGRPRMVFQQSVSLRNFIP